MKMGANTIHKRVRVWVLLDSILGFFQFQQSIGIIMACNFSILSLQFLNPQVSQFPQIPSFSLFNFIPNSRFRVSIRSSLSTYKLHSLPLQSSSPVSVCENSSIEHSFEVSYLINSFGWTPEVAISKAKNLKFKTPEKPERVLAFLKNHGFTETQISRLVKILPRILSSDPEDSLLPKLAFLRSVGLSRTEITKVVTKWPMVLNYSLEKRIKPTFNLILNLVKSNDEAVKIIKQYPRVLLDNLDIDRVQILREVGVPKENIVASMIHVRASYLPAPDNFRKTVEEVKEMGFDPRSKIFLFAVRAIRLLSNSNWLDKVQVFKKYGWSDDDILLAYRKSPKLIASSKNKIDGVMDFLVNRMGMEATTIIDGPHIITLSLKKRIVPRCLVYQNLLEKGLWKRKLGILTFCRYTENTFVARVIKPYEKEAPELLDLYEDLLDRGKELQS